MTDPLFSQILMFDPLVGSSNRGTATVPEGDRVPAAGRVSARDSLRKALSRVLIREMKLTGSEKAAFAGGSRPDVAGLAAAFVDVGSRGVRRFAAQSATRRRVSETRSRHSWRPWFGSTPRWRKADWSAAIEKLAEVILPDDLGDARGALAADNLNLRDTFIARVPQLTSAEVGARAGLQTKNPYATAARWKKSGDIFSVHHRGIEYFPAFQFLDGRPHPTVKKALGALPGRLSGWQRAFWFVSTNGWLDDRAPVDALDDADEVVAAARREGEEVFG